MQQKMKEILLKAKKIARHVLKRMTFKHYVIVVLLVALGVFNAVTALSPQFKQAKREKKIERTFNQWWEDEGMAQFIAAGLKPTEKIRNEEFEQYRERYLSENTSYIIEDQIARMRRDFRDYWENNGGKEAFSDANNRYPNEKDFENEFRNQTYYFTDKFLRYKLSFVPIRENFAFLATGWILSPGMISYLIFSFFFAFAFIRLQRRFGSVMTLVYFILAIALGGLFTMFLTTTDSFHNYANSRYIGATAGLAFLLGCTSFSNRKNITTQERQISIAGTALAIIADVFINRGILVTSLIVGPVLFGLGSLAGMKLPTRKLTQSEIYADSLAERYRKNAKRDPAAEHRERTRNLFDEGFDKGRLGFYDAAQSLLREAVTSLLKENPIDAPFMKQMLEKMEDPMLMLDYSSVQWFEWGEAAKLRKSFELAIIFFEKGLPLEKTESTARRALFNAGCLRILNKFDIEKGVVELGKVIKMHDNDIMAKDAQKLLEKVEATKKTASPNPNSGTFRRT